MLDVHVLTLPGLPEEWIKQRRDSIDAAVAAAGFPVFVHEVDGIDGHLGKSRRKGYAEGTQPYVTHVDHDDWIRADAFSVLREHLEKGVESVTTGEVLVNGGVFSDSPRDAHHLAVYKRDWVSALPYDRFKFYPDQYLISKAVPVHVPECVYFHRITPDSHSRKQRAQAPAEAREELRAIRDPRLFQVELMTAEQMAVEINKEIGDA